MVKEAVKFIKDISGIGSFEFSVLFGSGLSIGDENVKTVIPYSDIPGMPEPSVPGHEGKLKIVSLAKNVNGLVFEGRFHYYEGREDQEIRFIPNLSADSGCEYFISTSAVGAVSRKGAFSDVVLLVDHINLIGRNPLVGLIKEHGSKVFVDLKNIYDECFNKLFLKYAIEKDLKTSEGVFAAMLGPSYETFAEVGMLSSMGVDIVSMSTVPEIISAKFFGMKTAGFGVVANDTLLPDLSHEEVLASINTKRKKVVEVLFNTLINLFNPLCFKYS